MHDRFNRKFSMPQDMSEKLANTVLSLTRQLTRSETKTNRWNRIVTEIAETRPSSQTYPCVVDYASWQVHPATSEIHPNPRGGGGRTGSPAFPHRRRAAQVANRSQDARIARRMVDSDIRMLVSAMDRARSGIHHAPCAAAMLRPG